MAYYTIDRDDLLAAAESAGLDEEDVRIDYSGRGMYGDECVGIVGDAGAFARFVISVAHEVPDSSEWLDGVRQDSMGLSTIWYWPRVEVLERETAS